MGDIRESIDLSTITFEKKTYFIENEKHWAKLRFKRDQNNEPYLDVLAGKKSSSENNFEKNHFHAAYTIETEQMFVDDRNKIHNVKRTLDSNIKGRVSEEYDACIEFLNSVRLPLKQENEN